MAVSATCEGMFVDPQTEPGNPKSYGPAGEEGLILGVDTSLIGAITDSRDGRLHRASLSLEDESPENNLSQPIGSEKLGPATPDAVGRALLIGMAEHDDFTLTRTVGGWFEQTRVLHSAPVSILGETAVPHSTKLILLGASGNLEVARGIGRSMQVYNISLNAGSGAALETAGRRGSTEEDYGPDITDREPRNPLLPLDGLGACLELPLELDHLDPRAGRDRYKRPTPVFA